MRCIIEDACCHGTAFKSTDYRTTCRRHALISLPLETKSFEVTMNTTTPIVSVKGRYLVKVCGFETVVLVYAAVIGLTTPLWTAVIHTAVVAMMAMVPSLQIDAEMDNHIFLCILAIALGYGLQDLSHVIFQEKTYMSAYIYTRPLMLFAHSLWLLPPITLVIAGFTTTLLATARLGLVRTYFGSELGFVKPKWITGFPYGYIPHPMIVGQLMAFASIIYWWFDSLTVETLALLVVHMAPLNTRLYSR